jgi:hypothetical protein
MTKGKEKDRVNKQEKRRKEHEKKERSPAEA